MSRFDIGQSRFAIRWSKFAIAFRVEKGRALGLKNKNTMEYLKDAVNLADEMMIDTRDLPLSDEDKRKRVMKCWELGDKLRKAEETIRQSRNQLLQTCEQRGRSYREARQKIDDLERQIQEQAKKLKDRAAGINDVWIATGSQAIGIGNTAKEARDEVPYRDPKCHHFKRGRDGYFNRVKVERADISWERVDRAQRDKSPVRNSSTSSE